jgi:hypothetical protein
VIPNKKSQTPPLVWIKRKVEISPGLDTALQRFFAMDLGHQARPCPMNLEHQARTPTGLTNRLKIEEGIARRNESRLVQRFLSRSHEVLDRPMAMLGSDAPKKKTIRLL